MSNIFALGVPALYYLVLLALFTFLLVRGVTHLFVGLFLAGAVLHFAEMMLYLVFNQMPGGLGAYRQYLFILYFVSTIASLLFIAAFVNLAGFLLRGENKLPS